MTVTFRIVTGDSQALTRLRGDRVQDSLPARADRCVSKQKAYDKYYCPWRRWSNLKYRYQLSVFRINPEIAQFALNEALALLGIITITRFSWQPFSRRE